MAEPDRSLVELPQSNAAPAIFRAGMGYRGIFDGGAHLHLASLRTSAGDLSGLLTVSRQGRWLFRGRFNCASGSTRSSTVRYLRDRDAEFSGWGEVLERFCWHVLEMQRQGHPFEQVGDDPPSATQHEHAVSPLLPLNAATIVYGPGGAFKSTLAAAIAVTVASGVSPVTGWSAAPGRVLILDWESTRQEWNDRLRRIAFGMGLSAVTAITYRRGDRSLADQAETVAEFVAEQGVRLLIVDSVGLAQGGAREGNDANDATLRMFDAIRLIGTTTLLIDHVKGEDMENARAGTRPYGSIYKVNLARSVYELRRQEHSEYADATQVTLEHRKVNEGPKQGTRGLRIVHSPETILFEPCEVTASDLQHRVGGSTEERMVGLLTREGPMASQEIADELGVKFPAIRQALKRDPRLRRNLAGAIEVVA